MQNQIEMANFLLEKKEEVQRGLVWLHDIICIKYIKQQGQFNGTLRPKWEFFPLWALNLKSKCNHSFDFSCFQTTTTTTTILTLRNFKRKNYYCYRNCFSYRCGYMYVSGKSPGVCLQIAIHKLPNESILEPIRAQLWAIITSLLYPGPNDTQALKKNIFFLLSALFYNEQTTLQKPLETRPSWLSMHFLCANRHFESTENHKHSNGSGLNGRPFEAGRQRWRFRRRHSSPLSSFLEIFSLLLLLHNKSVHILTMAYLLANYMMICKQASKCYQLNLVIA